jgi:hypothetical protein
LENYIKDALSAIRADASLALLMCKDTADKHDLEPEWVIEQFQKAFSAELKKEGK